MKLDQLTFTRFIAAIAIVIYHFGLDTYPFNQGYLHAFFSSANVFVSYFFILSGFVMIIAYGKNEKQRIAYPSFYINRFARIYPLYILALLIKVLPKISHIDYKAFSFQATLLQAWIPGQAFKLNTAGWSLSVEAFFYLMFPIYYNNVVVKLKRIPALLILASFVIILHLISSWVLQLPFISLNPENSHHMKYLFPLFRMKEFIIGNFIGICYLQIPKSYYKNYDIIVAVLIALIILCIAVPAFNFFQYYLDLLFGLFILMLSLNTQGLISRFFNKTYNIKLGEISYGVYILQYPIWFVAYLVNIFTGVFNYVNLFYTSFIFLLISSLFAYYFIEMPGKEYIKGLFNSNRINNLKASPLK